MLRWILVLCVATAACGKGATSGGEAKVDLDADPLALLPSAVVAVANVDAKGIRERGQAGSEILALVGRLLPLGDEAGFRPSRDVDRVVVATYALGGADFAAVLSGHFDETAMAAATHAGDGTAITRGAYAGRTTYDAGPIEYAVLTPKTVVTGTRDPVRRLLDRVGAGSLDRALPPWMVDTVTTTGAEMALAADFATQPAMAAAVGALNLGWLKAVRVARIIGNFEPPGMNIAATLTYANASQAQAGVVGVKVVDGWLHLVGPALGGVSVQGLQVTAQDADLRCKFSVDDQTLQALVALAARYLPSPAASPQ